MRLPAKIFACSALVILALVGVAAWSLRAVGELALAHREIIDRALPALRLEASLRASVARLVRLEARHQALQEPAYGALVAQQADRAAADLERLGALANSPTERDLHRQAVEALAIYRRHLETSRSLIARGQAVQGPRPPDAPARLAAERVDQVFALLAATTAAEVDRAQSAAVLLERRTWIAVLLALGAGVLAALGASGLVAVRVTRSLRRLSAATASVAEGSFAAPLPVSTRDEVGELTSAFNAMAERLREMEGQKRRFFAHVSHELRNPLTAIRSASQLLLARAGHALDAKGRHWIELIDGSVDRLLGMVSEILDWNRLQAGVFPLVRRAVTLDAVVTAALDLLRPHAEQQGLALQESRAGADFSLVADEPALATVVGNLVGNALKFTPRGGSVWVDVADAGEELRLSVRDDGPGIPAGEAARIFEPYRQAHAGRQGSGFGLAIVRELVAAHGGTVHVESGEGQGTCFTVRLPRGGVPEAEEARAA